MVDIKMSIKRVLRQGGVCGLAEHCWTVRDRVRGLNHGGRVGNGTDGARGGRQC